MGIMEFTGTDIPPVLTVLNKTELIKQSMAAFDGEGVSYGVIANGFLADVRKAVQIASIQTLVRRYQYYRKPKLLIWDEAHHLGAKSWEELYKEFPESFHILLTATPLRLDGKGLGNYASELVAGPSVQWLIENKFLSPYRIYVQIAEKRIAPYLAQTSLF